MGLLSEILASKRILKDFVDISYEDQQNISRFFKLRIHMAELQAELEEKTKAFKTAQESLGEIELLNDNDHFPVQFGQIFLTYQLSEAKEIIFKRNEDMRKEIAMIKAKLATAKSNLNEVKSKLYHQFGSAILLEDEDEGQN